MQSYYFFRIARPFHLKNNRKKSIRPPVGNTRHSFRTQAAPVPNTSHASSEHKPQRLQDLPLPAFCNTNVTSVSSWRNKSIALLSCKRNNTYLCVAKKSLTPFNLHATMNNYKILVVDDEEDLWEILKSKLEKDGEEIDTANSAEKGLKREIRS